MDGTVRQCRRLFLESGRDKSGPYDSVACVSRSTWTVMLLVAVQDENTYDETLKEKAYDESNSSPPR